MPICASMVGPPPIVQDHPCPCAATIIGTLIWQRGRVSFELLDPGLRAVRRQHPFAGRNIVMAQNNLRRVHHAAPPGNSPAKGQGVSASVFT
jgi:hypothetical protein